MNNLSRTANNAIQYKGTLSKCLDLFAGIGAMRHQNVDTVISIFKKALHENIELSLKILFWARSCRGGAGEKHTFKVILEHICDVYPEFVVQNISNIVKYGYWKDLVRFTESDVPHDIRVAIVITWCNNIALKDRLACKWAPRKGELAKLLKQRLNLTWKAYRHDLKESSSTVEQVMCNKSFSDIEYQHVPSIAMVKYNKAFKKRDEQRFDKFVSSKDTKVNVSVLYPHDVFKSMHDNVELSDKQWKALPDYIAEGENILPMSDVSGSMSCCEAPEPMEISIALGLYLSERNKGKFKNKILTFSKSPEFFDVDPEWNILEKYQRVKRANWDMNTDFEKAYMLILDTGISYNVPQENMPTMILVLSDMQFDEASSQSSHFENMRDKFKSHGYKLPKIVFWNLNHYDNGFPATSEDDGVALVSGYSPALMKSVLACEKFDPINVMMEAVKDIKLTFPEV